MGKATVTPQKGKQKGNVRVTFSAFGERPVAGEVPRGTSLQEAAKKVLGSADPLHVSLVQVHGKPVNNLDFKVEEDADVHLFEQYTAGTAG